MPTGQTTLVVMARCAERRQHRPHPIKLSLKPGGADGLRPGRVGYEHEPIVAIVGNLAPAQLPDVDDLGGQNMDSAST
jgi:hypothetical protein